MAKRKGSYVAPTRDKAFLVIESLADHPQGLLASGMATALGRSLGELFRILVVMEEAGHRAATFAEARSRAGRPVSATPFFALAVGR